MSDFLPTLVRICEGRIYQLCLSRIPAVRCEAVAFIDVFLHQAVTNPADAMPTLVALLFDGRSEQAARQALHVLLSLADKKKEYLRFVEQKLMVGVRLGYALQVSLWTADSAQLFDPLDAQQPTDGSTNSQIPFDYFAQLYGILKKSAAQRKQIASNLINDLMLSQLPGDTAQRVPSTSPQSFVSPSLDMSPAPWQPARSPPGTPPLIGALQPTFSPSSPTPSSVCSSPRSTADKFGFLCFVARLLLHLPFDDDEPLHAAFHLSKIINTRGAALLATMDQLMQHLQQTSSEPTDEQLSRLAALADGAMAICVMLRARHVLVVSYALEARLADWSIANATARNAVKCSKKSDEPLSFHSFPFTDRSVANGSPAGRATSGASAVPAAPATPTDSPQSGRARPAATSARSRAKGGLHSRASSSAAASTADTAATSRPAIPPLLMTQYDFFVQQMAEAALFMQASNSSTAARQSGKRAGRGRRKRKHDDDGEHDTDRDDDCSNPPDAAGPSPAPAAASTAAHSGAVRRKATRRKASSGGGSTPQKKRRKRLTFSEKDIAAEPDDDDDDDGDDGDWNGD